MSSRHDSEGPYDPPQRRLTKLLAPEKRDIGIIIIYGTCSGIFALIIPIAVQTLVNTIAFGSMLQPILVLTLVVLLVLGVSAILRGLQVFLMEIVQQRMFARTALRLAKLIPQMKVQAFEGHHGPELINRFFDVLTVQKSTALIVIDGLSIVLQTIVGMLLLAFYHPILLAFDLLLVGMIFALVFFLGMGAIKSSILESKTKYKVAGWLEELARMPVLFKNSNAASFAFKYSDELTANYLKSRKVHFRILMRQIVGALSLQVMASSMLLGLGGWLVVKRQLTLGQLVAAELVVTSVVTGVGKFGKYLESYYDLVAAADKLGYLLDLPIENSGPHEISVRLEPQVGAFGAVGLKYAYPHFKPCLKGVHLRVQKSEKVAIFGKRSSGKSTLCDLFYRLKEPTEGRLELAGVSGKDIPLNTFRSDISFLRTIDLFEGSIAQNLQIHRADIPVQEIYTVLDQIGILEEIKALPNGLSTHITGGKVPLSNSLAKMLILARTLLTQPKIIVADCFFDDLDDDSKQRAVQTLSQNASIAVILTTGSDSFAKEFQSVYSLSDGKLEPRNRSSS